MALALVIMRHWQRTAAVTFNLTQTGATMNNEQIQTLVSTFAKENKISKVKLSTLVDSIMATLPKQGRPVLAKTKELHRNMLEYIRQGKTSAESLMQATGQDKVTIYNNLKALEKAKAIARAGNINTGKRGRQPVVYQVTI